jgi:ureidoglycolate lyase
MADILAHDNQSGTDLANPPSTRISSASPGTAVVSVHTVPLLRATAENLRGIGRPVRDFASEPLDIVPFPVSGWRTLVPGTGDEGGFVEDVFVSERRGRVQYSVNVGLGRKYVIGWYGKEEEEDAAAPDAAVIDPRDAARAGDDAVPALSHILTHEANYHPDGGQIICARSSSAFVLLLAPPGDNVRPESFRAFLVDPSDGTGTIGIHINPGTWHQPAFPVGGPAQGGAALDNRQGKVHGCVGVDFVSEFGCYLRVPLTRASLAPDTLPPVPSPRGPRLRYTILYVASVPASLDFYEAAFGLRRRFVAPDGTYAELETGATALAFASHAQARSNFGKGTGDGDGDGEAAATEPFAVASRSTAPPAMEVGFVVDDVAAAYARAVEHGAVGAAAPRTKPWGQVVAYVRDPDGFLVELCTAMG